jgi:DNA-binding NarL/FixJ family response regulator
MKILILEDHPVIAHLLETIIKDIANNIAIEHFTAWENALESMNRAAPDWVISDIQIGDFKQLELLEACHEKKIPFMVFSSFINPTIIDHCNQYKARVVVAKSSDMEDLKQGVKSLINNQYFRCAVCNNINHTKSRISEETPRVLFTPSEEFVILAQIEGKNTVQLSQETKKSKYTIRNQRMKLMEKNACTMEEIARRYLFWHTKG